MIKCDIIIHKVCSKKPLKVELKNVESKESCMHACVQMCRHFEQKRCIHSTFLLRPTTGEKAKDQKESIYTNLKTLKANAICLNSNHFEKVLVQVQERIKVDGKVYEKYLEHKRAHKDSHKGESWKPPSP